MLCWYYMKLVNFMVLNSECAKDFICITLHWICQAPLAAVCAGAKPSPVTTVPLGCVFSQHRNVKSKRLVFSSCGALYYGTEPEAVA